MVLSAHLGKDILKEVEALLTQEEKLPEDGVLAGGAVANIIFSQMWGGEPIINDFDIFKVQGHEFGLISQDYTEEPIRRAFLAAHTEQLEDGYGQHYLRTVDNFRYRITSTSRDGRFNNIELKYEVYKDVDLTKSVPTARLLLGGFDLNCTMVGIDLRTKELSWTKEFEDFLTSKQIMIVNPCTPFQSFMRAHKKQKEIPGTFVDLATEARMLKSCMENAVAYSTLNEVPDACIKEESSVLHSQFQQFFTEKYRDYYLANASELGQYSKLSNFEHKMAIPRGVDYYLDDKHRPDYGELKEGDFGYVPENAEREAYCIEGSDNTLNIGFVPDHDDYEELSIMTSDALGQCEGVYSPEVFDSMFDDPTIEDLLDYEESKRCELESSERFAVYESSEIKGWSLSFNVDSDWPEMRELAKKKRGSYENITLFKRAWDGLYRPQRTKLSREVLKTILKDFNWLTYPCLAVDNFVDFDVREKHLRTMTKVIKAHRGISFHACNALTLSQMHELAKRLRKIEKAKGTWIYGIVEGVLRRGEVDIHEFDAIELAIEKEMESAAAEVLTTALDLTGFKDKEFKYQIKELTTRLDLLKEGARMHHCVGGYAQEVKNQTSRIFHIICGEEESTLEIRITPSESTTVLDLLTHNNCFSVGRRQHTTAFNKEPGDDSRELCRRLIYYIEKNCQSTLMESSTALIHNAVNESNHRELEKVVDGLKKIVSGYFFKLASRNEFLKKALLHLGSKVKSDVLEQAVVRHSRDLPF